MSKPRGEKCKTCAVIENKLRCAFCKWKTAEWVLSEHPLIIGEYDGYKPCKQESDEE